MNFEIKQPQEKPSQRFLAIKMASLVRRIESLSDDDRDQLVALEVERNELLKQYYTSTFGSNVVPMLLPLS